MDSIIALAPMASVTDFAFRELCAGIVPNLFTTSEMVSAKALCYKDAKTARLMRISDAEPHASVQLFGSDPAIMAEAALMAEQVAGCKAIDLNMGCPTPKIVSPGDGCALMKDIHKAFDITASVVSAVSVPVTVKFRKGFDGGNVNCVEFAKAMESAGASAVCVHGRTRAQMYSGRADWDIIASVKRAVKIPVIANGDIHSPEAAVRCLNTTGADMYMIGRAALGNPWILSQIAFTLRGLSPPPLPKTGERLLTARKQIYRAAEDKGETVACLEARKHLSWYTKGIPGAARLRNEIMTVKTLKDLDAVIHLLASHLAITLPETLSSDAITR